MGDMAGAQHAHLTVVPIYVLERDAAFRGALEPHGLLPLSLEPVETQDLVETEPPQSGSISALLRPRAQVVGFRGRERLMKELLAWCGGVGFGARLLHGTGGQGKTRVAQELSDRLAEQRWATVWLRGSASAGSLTILGDVEVPLLIVVDYAETRGDQLPALLHACAHHSGETPTRVLMLARPAGSWWENLKCIDATTMALLDSADTVRLTELEPEPDGRIQAYRQAVIDLAGAMARSPNHQTQDWNRISSSLINLRNDPGHNATALTLCMTALADLLDAAESTTEHASSEVVEDRLLLHERRHWQRTIMAARPLRDLSESTLYDALAVAMLLGAATREQSEYCFARCRH